MSQKTLRTHRSDRDSRTEKEIKKLFCIWCSTKEDPFEFEAVVSKGYTNQVRAGDAGFLGGKPGAVTSEVLCPRCGHAVGHKGIPGRALT